MAKPKPDETMPPVNIAIPTFGYQNHVSIDCEHGLIRDWDATDAAFCEGGSAARGPVRQDQYGQQDVGGHGLPFEGQRGVSGEERFVSRIHRKKPPGRAMPETKRRANAIKSKASSGVEHVFAMQKDKLDLFVRTVGIARSTVKIGTANIVSNLKRLVLLNRLAAA